MESISDYYREYIHDGHGPSGLDPDPTDDSRHIELWEELERAMGDLVELEKAIVRAAREGKSAASLLSYVFPSMESEESE